MIQKVMSVTGGYGWTYGKPNQQQKKKKSKKVEKNSKKVLTNNRFDVKI